MVGKSCGIIFKQIKITKSPNPICFSKKILGTLFSSDVGLPFKVSGSLLPMTHFPSVRPSFLPLFSPENNLGRERKRGVFSPSVFLSHVKGFLCVFFPSSSSLLWLLACAGSAHSIARRASPRQRSNPPPADGPGTTPRPPAGQPSPPGRSWPTAAAEKGPSPAPSLGCPRR